MADTQSRVSPIVAIAAVALILFSVVGIGVMTGVIPSSRSTATSIPAPEPSSAQAPGVKSSAVPRTASPAPAVKKPPVHVAVNEPAPPAAPAPGAAARICAECGVIDAVNVTDQKGQGSGLGAAGGAVIGGLLGHQVGSGRGNTAATVVGAVGGAVAGNEVEKRVKTTKHYEVSVRMEDGSFRSFNFDNAPEYSVGEKVKVVDGRLVRS